MGLPAVTTKAGQKQPRGAPSPPERPEQIRRQLSGFRLRPK